MKSLRRFLKRLLNFATTRTADQRLRDEIAEHLALQIEENLRAGMSSAEARRQAALKVGSVEAIREQHHAEHSIPFIENLLFDLRYAVRMLLRSPGFSLISIATMALGVGATTAIYSVVDATLLHPLPYPNPGELVRVVDDLPGVGAQGVGISVPQWRDLESSGIFQAVAITGTGANVNLTGSAQPLRLSFKQVTPNYFAVLGVDAQLGRIFDPHDTTPGYNLEVVISEGLWRREFGADPHILGKALRLDNDVYHVVGVMPRGFRDQGSTSAEQNVELWAAAGFAGMPFPPPLRDSRLLSRAVLARMKPGLSIAAAQGQLNVLVASLKNQYPAEYPRQTAWTARLIPLSETIVGNVRQSLLLLFGAVGLVLLISCVNVADKLLPDGTSTLDYGSNPHGLVIFTPEGYYSVQIYRTDRLNFASGDKFKGTLEEYQDAALSMSLSFGRYSVDSVNHTITFQTDRSSVPNRDDTTAVRAYELKGDELSWKVAPDKTARSLLLRCGGYRREISPSKLVPRLLKRKVRRERRVPPICNRGSALFNRNEISTRDI